MDKFTKVTGVAAPLMRQNVDTDLIIRIERLVDNVTREGLGPYAFEQIRFKPDGSEDPDCIFNQTPYRDAPIILSRENFGCGSSREGAVWALKGMGIKAVIAPYFGDIFNNNCFQNGLLPVALPIHEIEQLASLRAIPQLDTIRPADANEVAEAWRVIMSKKDHPTALVMTRQKVPVLDREKYADASGLARGGYVLADGNGKPEVILIATGSEVHLAIEAHEMLLVEGINSRVVSLPSWYLFDRQDEEYRDSVLPPDITNRVAIEQASTMGWERYIGETGTMIGMTTFGASGPFKDLAKYFGFTPDDIVDAAKAQIAANA